MVGSGPGAPKGKTASVIAGLECRSVTICPSVAPINTGAGTALKPIKGTVSAGYIAITPNGKTAYVSLSDPYRALARIEVGINPGAIAIRP